MLRTVIFDLDGTLLDTLRDLANAGNHALAAMGLPERSLDEFRTFVGNGIPKLIWRMLPEGHRGEMTCDLALRLFQGHYSQHMLDLTAPYPGIVDLLERLRTQGLKLGVLSNKADHLAGPVVEAYFPGIFDAVLGLREDFPPKPDAASLFYLLDRMGADKEALLYVGDSDVDMLTAKNAGVPSCGVLWGFRSREHLLEAGAEHLVETAEALGDYILRGADDIRL